MKQRQIVVYFCNAVDEVIKVERNITTDSPAATNKVFALAQAMHGAGLSCRVLSLGRGRQNNSGAFYPATARRVSKGVAVYAAFLQFPLLTHLVSSMSLVWLLAGLIRRHPCLCVLVYNRSYHYLPALILARLWGVQIHLDLEDGFITDRRGSMRRLKNFFTMRLFGWLCPNASMCANSSLGHQLTKPPEFICYGVASADKVPCQDWRSQKLQVLFSGTLIEEVGCDLLLDALELLRRKDPFIMDLLHIVVTGKGPVAEKFRCFSELEPDLLSFHGSQTRSDYLNILRSSHVGLSLRLSAYEMGATTFPSKVVEYAEHGLLIVTTRVSDVPSLFGDEALYLERESPEHLAELLTQITELRENLRFKALEGRRRVIDVCAPEVVGVSLRNMLIQRS